MFFLEPGANGVVIINLGINHWYSKCINVLEYAIPYMNTKLENPGKTLGADLSANSVTVL
jgi:hypothetical protein